MPNTDTRRAAVLKARDSWVNRLIDVSQRNNLLYFRPLKVGTLDLTSSDEEHLAALLSGKRVAFSKLLPNADLIQVIAQAKEIARKAKENTEERGLETLFLAAGFASWEGEEGKRPPEAAILLVPVALDARNRAGPSIERTGEPQINPVLLHFLATNFRCPIPSDVLLNAADTDPDRDDDPFNLDALLAKLAELGKAIPKFEVRRRVVLGNFSFQKMAMVRDLRELDQRLCENDIIAALAGDAKARDGLGRAVGDPDPRQFDRIPPEKELLALDTDSSQQKAIHLAHAGQSMVIQGPPGTGKSQVIATLIISAAAAGKRVLFVAEKRAALQVVLDRLNRCGLGHLALDLHGADTSRKVIASRLRDALENIGRGAPVVADSILQRFDNRRSRLNAHAERMHAKRLPAELSVFELQSRLVHYRAKSQLKTRFRGQSLMRLSPSAVASTKDLLIEAAALGNLFLGTSSSLWMSATFSDGHALQAAIDLAEQLAEKCPGLISESIKLLQLIWPEKSASVEQIQDRLKILTDVADHLQEFKPSVFSISLGETIGALTPASRNWLARCWSTLTSASYRRAKGLAASQAARSMHPRELLSGLERSEAILARWKNAGFSTSTPTPIAGVSESLKLINAIIAEIGQLGLYLNRNDLHKLSVENLGTTLSALQDDVSTARRIPLLRKVEARLSAADLATLAAELKRAHLPGDEWPNAFEYIWLRSCLEHAWAEEGELAGFDGKVHNRHASEFCQLDKDRLQLAAQRVQQKHIQEAAKMLGELTNQASVVRHEANKKMRHLPFRKLAQQAPDVVAALFPCFMCSPLSVSQLLPGDQSLFDLVIFDEASQVLPEDAVASLVRARQAVVAGDEHQLPPTHFFAGGLDGDGDSEEADPSEGFESLLKLMKAFVPAPMLEWHYRSRDERLIAFSNRHIYSDRLITFPGPGGSEPAVEHRLVQIGHAMPSTESDSAEVRCITELAMQHARRELRKPPPKRQSLGVIALGITHARRVEAAIEQELEKNPDLDEFFDPNLPERFFVKNLERVQGDERDAIILTLGVAPDAAGVVALTRFGPLNNREQGYRRLNVAITRARQKMILVSSFTHHAIDVAKPLSRGVELLRQYLQFAASGGTLSEDHGRSEIALNTFEADIADALAQVGIATVPQWGASSYRIDLVAQHPSRPGRLVLAIECDGATYHSAPTARDRDRLRQQHLEALGWKFHRIWSTDWFNRRDEEVCRAVRAFEAATRFADTMDVIEQPLNANA